MRDEGLVISTRFDHKREKMGIIEDSGVRIFRGLAQPKKYHQPITTGPKFIDELEAKKAKKVLAEIE